MSTTEKDYNKDGNNTNNLLQTVLNLSSQSNESSNIIIQAISNGIATGLSQGIASGKIPLSFQDLISLASVFKPSNEIPLQLIERIPNPNAFPEPYLQSADPSNSKRDSVLTLDNPDSHDSSQASSGFPSSVHVCDVTVEKYPAQELQVPLRVLGTGDDYNVKNSSVSFDSSDLAIGSIQDSSRKRLYEAISDDNSSGNVRNRLRCVINEKSVIKEMSELLEYLSLSCNEIPETVLVAHDKLTKNDLMTYTFNLIDLCDRKDVMYYDQSLVVFEVEDDATKTGKDDAESICPNFFDNNKVSRLIAIQRPQTAGQIYIADGLHSKYHFSCPTSFLPSLINAIERRNNSGLQFLLIPRSMEYFKNDTIEVLNDISSPEILYDKVGSDTYQAVIDSGDKNGSSSIANSKRRSNFTISIGLQTMYSHEQHRARSSMLPHSKPHVPTVRKYPAIVIKSILSVYDRMVQIICQKLGHGNHPFMISEETAINEYERKERLLLRADLLKHLCRQMHPSSCSPDSTPNEIMFESCTVQATGALGFHRDAMNCPSLHKTIAFIIPIEKVIEKEKHHCCLTYLFYSRKCVSDFAKKKAIWETYIRNIEKCGLARLALRSLLNVGGIYDYQGSLYEAEDSLNDIAWKLMDSQEFSCPEVESFCGLPCFKHGAAYDKMGYYSVFVNVFLCLYYKGMTKHIDDSISLCMFFGLICNGTSSLAAVWRSIYDLEDQVLNWFAKKNHPTRLFDLLLKVNRVVCKKLPTDNGTVLYGNCKLPRFQYANHSAGVIENSTRIHDIVKEFFIWRTSTGKSKDSVFQHNHLFTKLKKLKGVGPLSFNQLWHSMCLCGILPVDYIQSIAVAPAAGPAKLIKTFYPYLTTQALLGKKIGEVKREISNIGLKTITDFFLENMFCEIWRLATAMKLLVTKVSAEEKRQLLLSEDFNHAIISANKPTRYPDIYYCNPYTEEFQHLFRVLDKELVMRPSFAANTVGGSVNVSCQITYDNNTGKTIVSWGSDNMFRSEKDASKLFI